MTERLCEYLRKQLSGWQSRLVGLGGGVFEVIDGAVMIDRVAGLEVPVITQEQANETRAGMLGHCET